MSLKGRFSDMTTITHKVNSTWIDHLILRPFYCDTSILNKANIVAYPILAVLSDQMQLQQSQTNILHLYSNKIMFLF